MRNLKKSRPTFKFHLPRSSILIFILLFPLILLSIDRSPCFFVSAKDSKDKKGTRKRNDENVEAQITQEMFDLILRKVKPGGSSGDNGNGNGYNNLNKFSQGKTTNSRKKKKKKRNSTSGSSSNSKSSSFTSSSSSTNNPLDTISTKVTVTIPGYGKAEGRRETAVDIWKGIPYAAPPVGSLRFAPPEAAPPWIPSQLDASKYAPDCYQLVDPVLNPGADLEHMSEDCLYLNVFTPAGHVGRSHQGKFLSGGTKLLPVMLWLHGGAFQQGGARRPEYDGRRLAERDIIVVSINYRLGALGFLVSSPDGLYGNFGLMDQRAAIDWVKNNIQAFGGDPENITLFGESAGAVMIGLHLLMDGAGTLFHKAIMQSNPLGYTFRSVVIADFIGEALKRNVDCRDLTCLRAERVEEIMRAQSSLMGVPRSVGDFFTWGPTLTKEVKVNLSLTVNNRFISRSEENRIPRLDTDESHNSYVSEWRLGGDELTSDRARWSAVNVSQPLKMISRIPDNIPVIIGTNQNEGEMFVHSAFPAPMPKPVYWMFVGALFRDSAGRVLRHYRGLVEEVEHEAEELARRQLEEEENRQEYLENKEKLDSEYEMLLTMNATRRGRGDNVDIVRSEGLETLVKTWSSGGFMNNRNNANFTAYDQSEISVEDDGYVHTRPTKASWRERFANFANKREEKYLARLKQKALKEAAKVNVDYRPVMSAIINDYLFRCPSWHFAQLLTRKRAQSEAHENNVYVYRFSLPTHIPGYKECWGKSCHTAELPYVFQAMETIRSNYSTLGPYAQKEAPSAPEYPYSQIMAAYRGALEAVENFDEDDIDTLDRNDGNGVGFGRNHTKAFQRILSHFFGDYFKEDADEEMATDMSERWASFARLANPNYDGSKADWLPWRHKSVNSTFFSAEDPSDPFVDEMLRDQQGSNIWPDDQYDYWSESDEYETDNEADSEYSTSVEEYYRYKALELMQMNVAIEDVFRTELKRVSYSNEVEDDDTSFLRGKWRRWYNQNGRQFHPTAKLRANEARRIAQEFGVMGIGLSEDSVGKVEIHFPELLELTWPPEGRLVERDCTCDLWDRIRYRY